MNTVEEIWTRIRRRDGWYIRHARTGELLGPFGTWQAANGRAAALNRRHERQAKRRELTGFVRAIRDGDVYAIAVAADWQEEHGRSEGAERLRAIVTDFERVRFRPPRRNDRLPPDERLRRAIARACTKALRLLDDWWIRRRQNKLLLAQRAGESARTILRSPVGRPSISLPSFADGR